MGYSQAFFALQVGFAAKVARLTDSALANTLASFTPAAALCALAPNSARWQEICRVEGGAVGGGPSIPPMNAFEDAQNLILLR